MRKPKISLKTENGKWYVRNGSITIVFENAEAAMYFIDLCYRAVR